MIVEEKLIINNQDFVKHYSNNNMFIQKVGTNEKYAEAIDLAYKGYKYVETNEEIPVIEEPEPEEEIVIEENQENIPERIE